MAVTQRLSSLFRRLFLSDVLNIAWNAFNKACPATPEIKPALQSATRDLIGIEIGGPSPVFYSSGIFSVYSNAARIDNVNFSSKTAWESDLRDGGPFLFCPRKPPGHQFLREASDLHGIADATYDFLLSSHCLEHVANPLAALREWRRVVRPGGHIIVILPDPAHTFDHRRPLTSLDHLQTDYANRTGENDLTHLDEVLSKHDLRRDHRAGTIQAFRTRSLLNAQNRCLHHHVFDLALLKAALVETGWQVLTEERVRPFHLIALGRRPA